MKNELLFIEEQTSNQKLINWEMETLRLTQSVKDLLVKGDDNLTYIRFTDLIKLNVECGGSPFTYTYKYDSYNDRWSIDKSSEGSYYLSEDKNEDDYSNEELFDLILQNLNYPNLGSDLINRVKNRWSYKLDRSYIKDEIEFLISWDWVLYQIDNITNGYGDDIIFSQSDLDTISYMY